MHNTGDDLDIQVQVSLMTLTEIQDSLLAAVHDLHRLNGLVAHATEQLLERFDAVGRAVRAVDADGAPVARVGDALKQAVTELQFQDMSSQLLLHTVRLLEGCAFRLSAEAMEPEPDEVAVPFEDLIPAKPNPVSQSEMDAGSIELF